MKVNTKKLGDNIVRLECVATVDEVNNALHSAQLAFAQNMGLQPEKDKTVAQVAEEKMGVKDLDSIVQGDALQALVPFALDKKNLIPAFPPKPEAKSAFKRGQQFAFALEVTLRPEYELTSYEPVSISVPPFAYDETIVDNQIADLAERFLSYQATDDKPVEAGDACMIALQCTKDGEPVPNMNTEGRSFVAGQGYMPEGFENAILGMVPGETKSFSFEAPGFDDDFNQIMETIDCVLTVKEIQVAVKPEINDEWVKSNMPMFNSLQALRDALTADVVKVARDQYDNYCMQIAVAELAKRFQGNKISDEIYEATSANLRNNLVMGLKQQGKTWDEFVKENGGEQQFGMMLMMQTRELLVQGYALDAVYRHEKLTLEEADINAACRAINPQANPKQLREQFEKSGRGFALRESAERYKANRWLLDNAVITIVEQ